MYEEILVYYSQPKKLAFIDQGATLLQSTRMPSAKSKGEDWRNNIVVVWDMTNAKPRYLCPGILIGASRDGSTFLTHQNNIGVLNAEEKCRAWDTATGIEIPLKSLNANDYELHQRIQISAVKRSELTLRLTDAFSKYSPQTLRVGRGYAPNSGAFLETWAMAPNNHYIIATLSGDVAGFDWASGESISIEQGKTDLIAGAQSHKFEVNRFQGDARINFSSEHDVVAISSAGGSFTVYGLDPWRRLREVWVHGFQHVVGFNPKHQWLVAASARAFIRQADKSKALFYIHLLDIERLTRDGAIIQRGKDRGILEETHWVDRLLFHPNGQCLASLLNDDTVHMWDIGSGKITGQLSLSQHQNSLNVAP
jgi:WD40 repeat protein